MTEKLSITCRKEILGKEINFYGSLDNPYFLPSEIAIWLGVKNHRQMILSADLSEEQKGVFLIDSLGGEQETTMVTEDGLYDILMLSRKPLARPLKKEIKAYLKQIRKTGGYIPVTSQDDDLTIMARAHQILERTIAQKDQIIQQLKPKADTYDMIMDSVGTFSMNQVAKQVGMGEYHLFAYLRGKKVLFYEGTDNVPYERFRKNGCFKVIDTVAPDGKSHSTTRVTQKGLNYICKIIRKDNMEVA